MLIFGTDAGPVSNKIAPRLPPLGGSFWPSGGQFLIQIRLSWEL
jgi:hypothetical protein